MRFDYSISFEPRIAAPRQVQVFPDDAYAQDPVEPFEETVRELMAVSVRLLTLMPDPSLGPDERIERISRVIPSSQLQSAHRRSARNKLVTIRRRLDDLVPHLAGKPSAQVEYMVERVHQLVDGDQKFIEKLEAIGDLRATDIGVSPRQWQ